MIRLLQLLFLGHVHKWKIISETPMKRWSDEIGKGQPQTGMHYMLQCEKCGCLKQFDTV